MNTYFKYPSDRQLSQRRMHFYAAAALFVLPAALALPNARADVTRETLRTLIVGGGPNVNKNQVAIESNVRYVTRLLPNDHVTETLFADGDVNNPTVLYTPASAADNSPANVVFRELLGRQGRLGGQGGRRGGRGQREGQEQQGQNQPATGVSTPAAQGAPATAPPAGSVKVPHIARLDGPATSASIESAFTKLGGLAGSAQPYFLYFTGHGNLVQTNRDKNYFENNHYALWNDGRFTVQDLSQQIARLPQKESVVLVMVQCYSGAFGNVIFENGDPQANLADRDIVGFFASTKDRLAAGCSPSINEEYYRDFTSYFFAALTGRDRLDRPFVIKADYNDDGKIGLDEAFYWSLINDVSIDVPVATSDVFLERFVPLEGDTWQNTPYQTLLQWASPAQRIVLEELSKALELQGDQRVRDAQNLDVNRLGGTVREQQATLNREIQAIVEPKRQELLATFPNLNDRTNTNYEKERNETLQILEKEIAEGKWEQLTELLGQRSKQNSQVANPSVSTAKRLRFLRLAQKVVRDNTLRTQGEKQIQERYFRLLKEEARTDLLPYHNS